MDEQLKTHGAFSWCELMTTDANAAKDFYTKLFGWTTEEMSVTPGMTYTVVKVGGKGIGGIMSMPSQAPGMPPHWPAMLPSLTSMQSPKTRSNLGERS